MVFVRAAGLLSRVATAPRAQQQLQEDPSALAAVARAIEANHARSGLLLLPGPDEAVAWVMDEREHLARVAAAALSGPGATLAVAAWHAANTFAVLLAWLPPPRADAASGHVTAASVVMPPRAAPTKDPGSRRRRGGNTARHHASAVPGVPSARLCGNVVKCFVPVVEQPASPAAQRLLQAGLLERLVALLANTQVRKAHSHEFLVISQVFEKRAPFRFSTHNNFVTLFFFFFSFLPVLSYEYHAPACIGCSLHRSWRCARTWRWCSRKRCATTPPKRASGSCGALKCSSSSARSSENTRTNRPRLWAIRAIAHCTHREKSHVAYIYLTMTKQGAIEKSVRRYFPPAFPGFS